MSLPPEVHERWMRNLRAAGIEPGEQTIQRIAVGLAERIEDLYGLFERLNYGGENPDFLRDTPGDALRGAGHDRA